MNEKRLKEINNEEKVLLKHLNDIRKERNNILCDDITKKIDFNQIYRINYWVERELEESAFSGFITDCWFSFTDNCYEIELCYFTHCKSDYMDSAYSTFVAFSQREIKPEDIQDFVNSLVPISDEEFNSSLSEWLAESEKSIKDWFLYFKNKNYEENEE